MNTGTWLFLAIGAVGVVIAAIAVLGGDLFDLGDGFVNTEVISALVGGFGFGAAAANELVGAEAGQAVVILLGLAIGAIIAWLAWLASSRLRNMPTDATPNRDHLAGTTGVVVTPVPAEGFGEVLVRIGGQPVKLSARSARPLPFGAKVLVLDALSDTSVIVEESTPTTL
ncbi:membrane protein implicated in regulation of membrane protease activity [Allocatelliglobosispora scoriae]|uniref:Membrane protein implicated in regulation of membrane protease activity n=1 Tax=Allocatelliglobosispora scoriae TaxID=643052 RepID=A0A841BYB2_9ACTN|nr:NfeD family protein [Allocatelliglobosispora scoriae]MBB5872109.1 membrane protein implicated in regulation of membrane protease activity [Allocatelliglobosispora scoriae]